MQIYSKFAHDYTHNNTAAMKNTQMIPTVSITKLNTFFSIIVVF